MAQYSSKLNPNSILSQPIKLTLRYEASLALQRRQLNIQTHFRPETMMHTIQNYQHLTTTGGGGLAPASSGLSMGGGNFTNTNAMNFTNQQQQFYRDAPSIHFRSQTPTIENKKARLQKNNTLDQKKEVAPQKSARKQNTMGTTTPRTAKRQTSNRLDGSILFSNEESQMSIPKKNPRITLTREQSPINLGGQTSHFRLKKMSAEKQSLFHNTSIGSGSNNQTLSNAPSLKSGQNPHNFKKLQNMYVIDEVPVHVLNINAIKNLQNFNYVKPKKIKRGVSQDIQNQTVIQDAYTKHQSTFLGDNSNLNYNQSQYMNQSTQDYESNMPNFHLPQMATLKHSQISHQESSVLGDNNNYGTQFTQIEKQASISQPQNFYNQAYDSRMNTVNNFQSVNHQLTNSNYDDNYRQNQSYYQHTVGNTERSLVDYDAQQKIRAAQDQILTVRSTNKLSLRDAEVQTDKPKNMMTESGVMTAGITSGTVGFSVGGSGSLGVSSSQIEQISNQVTSNLKILLINQQKEFQSTFGKEVKDMMDRIQKNNQEFIEKVIRNNQAVDTLTRNLDQARAKKKRFKQELKAEKEERKRLLELDKRRNTHLSQMSMDYQLQRNGTYISNPIASDYSGISGINQASFPNANSIVHNQKPQPSAFKNANNQFQNQQIPKSPVEQVPEKPEKPDKPDIKITPFAGQGRSLTSNLNDKDLCKDGPQLTNQLTIPKKNYDKQRTQTQEIRSGTSEEKNSARNNSGSRYSKQITHVISEQSEESKSSQVPSVQRNNTANVQAAKENKLDLLQIEQRRGLTKQGKVLNQILSQQTMSNFKENIKSLTISSTKILTKQESISIRETLNKSCTGSKSRYTSEEDELIANTVLVNFITRLVELRSNLRQLMEGLIYDYDTQDQKPPDEVEYIIAEDLFTQIHNKLKLICQPDQKEKFLKVFAKKYKTFTIFDFFKIENDFFVLDEETQFDYSINGKNLKHFENKTIRILNRINLVVDRDFESDFVAFTKRLDRIQINSKNNKSFIGVAIDHFFLYLQELNIRKSKDPIQNFVENFKIGKGSNIKLNLTKMQKMLEFCRGNSYMKSMSTRKRKPKKQPTVKDVLNLGNISQIEEDENSLQTDGSESEIYVNEEKN